MNKYGSIEAVEDDTDFDIKQTYYLGKTKLNREQIQKKAISVGVPLLAAFLIIGIAAYYLLNNFGNLYPSPGGESDNTDENHWKKLSPLPAPIRSGPPGIAFPDPDCSVNKLCAERGLNGQCCPTSKGEYLNCC